MENTFLEDQMALVSKTDFKDVLKMGVGIAVATVVITPLVTALVARFKL